MNRAERIKEAHRAARHAESASQSRLKALDRAGLSWERHDDFHYLIAGEYWFNPVSSFWRHGDDDEKFGYTVPALALQIALRRNRNAPGLAVMPEPGIATPIASCPPIGEARCASDETGPGENVGNQFPGARGEAAVSEGRDADADSRDLLPVVTP